MEQHLSGTGLTKTNDRKTLSQPIPPVASGTFPHPRKWPPLAAKQSGEAVGTEPLRLTDAMIRAACKAFYKSENVDGTSMTFKGIDYSFRAAFRRMWKGAMSAYLSQPEQSALAAVGEGVEPVGYTSKHELVRIKKACMGRFADVSDGDFTVALYTVPPPSPDVAALQAENERLTATLAVRSRQCSEHMQSNAANYARAEASEALVADMREAHQRIVDLDEAMGHDLTVDHAFEAIAISAAALSRLDTSKTEERS